MMKYVAADLIAPCGMNCVLCMRYGRARKACQGCHGDDLVKSASCRNCPIKNCPEAAGNDPDFCYVCAQFPCKRLQQMDKRYRAKYYMSLIDNLEYIRDKGMGDFLEREVRRWTCDVCGDIVCVHSGQCLSCKTPIRNNKGEL